MEGRQPGAAGPGDEVEEVLLVIEQVGLVSLVRGQAAALGARRLLLGLGFRLGVRGHLDHLACQRSNNQHQKQGLSLFKLNHVK